MRMAISERLATRSLRMEIVRRVQVSKDQRRRRFTTETLRHGGAFDFQHQLAGRTVRLPRVIRNSAAPPCLRASVVNLLRMAQIARRAGKKPAVLWGREGELQASAYDAL